MCATGKSKPFETTIAIKPTWESQSHQFVYIIPTVQKAMISCVRTRITSGCKIICITYEPREQTNWKFKATSDVFRFLLAPNGFNSQWAFFNPLQPRFILYIRSHAVWEVSAQIKSFVTAVSEHLKSGDKCTYSIFTYRVWESKCPHYGRTHARSWLSE